MQKSSLLHGFSHFCIHSRHHRLTDWILIQKSEPKPFTAHFSFHSPKDDRLLKKDDRVLSQTRPRFLKRRSFLSYKLFVVIYTKECINLQNREIHFIKLIIGTPTDWFSAWSDDGVKVTLVIFELLKEISNRMNSKKFSNTSPTWNHKLWLQTHPFIIT